MILSGSSVASTELPITIRLIPSGRLERTTELKFRYMSDEVMKGVAKKPPASQSKKSSWARKHDGCFVFGSSLASDSMSCFSNKGEGTIDVYSWVHQVGGMANS